MIKLNKTRFRSKLDRFFNSPGRVRALFITLIILVLILGASNFFNTISKGTDENLFQDTKNGITLIAITKGGASDRAGLKVGDVILRINDRSVANALEAHRVIYESDVGNTLEYVVQRNGEQLTFQVVLASFGVNKLVVILYLTGLMGLIAAALFGLLRPHLKEARLLSATFLFFGASLFSALTLDISVSSALQGLSSPMTLFLFFYSGLYFPVLRRDILEHRWLIRAFKLSGFIVVTCCLIGILLILQNLDSNQFLSFAKPISYTLRVLILLLALFGLIIFVVHRKTRPPETKRYTNYIKWSAVLTVLAFWGTLLWAVIAKTPWILYCQYAFFSLMLLPIAYLYTAHRFRLLEYNPVVRRSRVYVGVSSLINLAFILTLVLGVIWLPKMEVNYPGIWFTERSIEIGFVNDLPLEKREHWKLKAIVVATILLIMILWRLRTLLQNFIARKFYQEKYDYKKALAEFSGIVACCWDPKQLSNQVVHKLSDLMHLKNIGITLARNGELVPTEAHGFENEQWEKVRFHTNSSWLKQLARESTPRSIENVTPKEKAILKKLGASFLAPITLNGRLLGLFVLGEKLSEDHFRVEDIELLEAAASQTAVALENANLHKNLQDQERLKNEMQLAQKIQLGSLPKKVPDVPGLEIFATSKPASEVGGDYYDFLKYNDQQFMTIVGDVSGKGTSAALYVAKIQGIMRSIYEYHPSPADLFAKLNDVLRGDIEKNYFITQVGVKFDLQKRMATLARAGHEPVLYYNSKEQTVHFMESNGLGLCLGSPDEFKQQLQEITVPFNSGDYFILFTDGITDARDQQDHEFGEKRLLETLKKTDNGTAEQIGNGIINRVKEFTTGAQRFDDMTVCVVKVK